MQLRNYEPDSGLYSIWQVCTLDWTGFQTLLIVTFAGTELPKNITQVQYLVQFCQIRIGKYQTFGLTLNEVQTSLHTKIAM